MNDSPTSFSLNSTVDYPKFSEQEIAGKDCTTKFLTLKNMKILPLKFMQTISEFCYSETALKDLLARCYLLILLKSQ